jgi:16S rRNA (guanine527-N7)-methyltransferase
MNELWNTIAGRAAVKLDAERHALLGRYLDLLLTANETMNLTRITDRAAAEVQHVADSLTVLPYLPPGACSVADVGSGGGVPGIPLAIARPDAAVTLIEATKKKADFLKRAVESLGLTNVTIAAIRAEEAGNGALRESFDVAIARAVATIDWLAEWCLPLAKKGGRVLLMKGPRHADELPKSQRAIRLLGGGEPAVHPVDLPGSKGLVIVEIRKTGRSDKRYPRPAHIAKGKPMG